MTELYFVRHPETTSNADRSIVAGRDNQAPLTLRGKGQIKQFAESYQQAYPSPDLIVASPAVRTVALAKGFIEHTGYNGELLIEPDLQEMSQGTAEKKQRKKVYTPKVIADINEQLFDFAMPKGESLNQTADRMLEWAWRVHEQYPDSTILAATHGQAIRATVGRILDWSHHQVTLDPSISIPNVSLTHLSVNKEGIVVNFYGKEIIENATQDNLVS